MIKRIRHELNYLQKEDIIAVFTFMISIIPAIIAKAIFLIRRKRIWIITEDKNEARDNGFCFFKYLNSLEERPLVYYAINYESPDYAKVSEVGKTIKYGSVMHWIYYLNAEYNISTQKAGKPNAAVGYVLEHLRVVKNRFIFLQHGITLNRAEWLFYKNTFFRLFICGAQPEFYYVQKEFGYPEENVAYLGFCRFDDYHSEYELKRQILLIPSWREWIGSKNEYSKAYEDVSDFSNTEYYQRYQSLINNSKLHSILENKNINLVFYPHRNMQKFIGAFHSDSERVSIVSNRNSDIRKLLMESSLMITDYSSVSLDFAYMKKPVVFYQFDKERFREAQYAEGYFDYESSGLGVCVNEEEELVSVISEIVSQDFSVDERFIEAHSNFFSLYDNKNCARTYEKLKGLKHE